MTDLGKAYVQIIPSAKGISAKISQAISPAGKTAGESLGRKIGSVAAKAFAAVKVGKTMVDSIMEGGKLQQSLGGIETLFKGNAGRVKEYASQAFKTTGMSANAYMENVTGFSASLLQSLGGDTKKAADISNMAMTDMSDNSNKMGTSMDRITDAYQGFAKQNYTMLDNLKLGYGGTKTEMERLLSDATKLTGVKYDISNLSDVYEAIHAIQGKMEITGTTAEEASGTLTGSFSMMKAAFLDAIGGMSLGGQNVEKLFSNLGKSIGIFLSNLLPMIGNIVLSIPSMLSGLATGIYEGIIPVLSSVAEGILEFGKTIASKLGEGIQVGLPQLLICFQSFLSGLGVFLTNQLPIFLEQGSQWIMSLIDGILLNLPTLMESFLQLCTDVISFLLSYAPQFIETAIDWLSNLVVGLIGKIPDVLSMMLEFLTQLIQMIADNLPQWLEKGGELISKLLTGISDNIPKVLSAIAQMLVDLVKKIIEYLPKLLSSGQDLIKNLVVGIANMVGTVINKIAEIGSKIISKIKTFLTPMLNKGGELITNLMTGISNKVNGVITKVKDLGTSIVNTISGFVGDMKNAGWNLLTGLANGIGEAIGSVVARAQEAARSVISNVKGVFGIHSPSKVFDEMGKNLDYGLANGISNNLRPVSKAINEMENVATRDYSSVWDLTSNINGSGFKDYEASSYDESSTNMATPLNLNLTLGAKSFRAFVEDISKLQNEEIELQLNY